MLFPSTQATIPQGQGQMSEPHYESAVHTISLIKQSSPDSRSVSSLTVMGLDQPLRCYEDRDISIKYTIVGESQGFVNMMYLVSR